MPEDVSLSEKFCVRSSSLSSPAWCRSELRQELSTSSSPWPAAATALSFYCVQSSSRAPPLPLKKAPGRQRKSHVISGASDATTTPLLSSVLAAC